jgi:hypothetical protein
MYAIQSPQQPHVGDLKTVISISPISVRDGVAAGSTHAANKSNRIMLNGKNRFITFFSWYPKLVWRFSTPSFD